jgi:predicted SAM-dependent methyltransferase
MKMITEIRKLYYFFFNRLLNQIGNRRKCYVCNKTFCHFTKWQGGSRLMPQWIKKLEMGSSDVDNFKCPFCGSHDRERHLYMFFDKLNFWEKMKDYEILHFAPERNLSKKIEHYSPLKYIKADLYSEDNNVQKIDATEIPYENATFNLVICNHVLEHIPDYMKALREIHRVLKPGGTAILQTPYSKLFKKNFEDEGINTEELKLVFYGQKDHIRIFSEKQFFQNLTDTGYILDIIKHETFFNDDFSMYFGVNKNEDLIKVTKPKN